VVLHPDDDGAVERGVGLAVAAAVEPVPGCPPEDAGILATPQSPAQAVSDRMRLMLSPATMSSSAAVSGPILLGVDRGAWLPGRPEGLPSDGGTSAGSGDLCGGLRWVTRTVDRDWILWMRSGRRGQAAAMAVLPDSLSDGKRACSAS